MADDYEQFENGGAGDEESLDEEERTALRRDLTDVQVLKELLAPRGIKGTVFYCPDCEEDHYLTWDLLANNLLELLRQGESPVHEPAFEPNPDDYVTWDYAGGFVDGYQSFVHEEIGEVAGRLAEELQRRGWRGDEIGLLLKRSGLETLLRDDASDGRGD